MKLKYLAIGLMMLFCLNVYGQQNKTVPMTVQPQKTEVQVLEETVSLLQAENQAMQKQLESMEKEMDLYRGDVRTETSKMNTNMALWLAVLTIIMAILGVAIPLILNRRNERSMEKMLEDVKKQANSADDQAKEATKQAEQAKQAVADIVELKIHVNAIEKRINDDAIAAEKAAKEAKASQLFTQALAEQKESPLSSIFLYTQALKYNPEFSVAYNNRAILNIQLGKLKEAMDDYNKAIELRPDYADAYNNRGNLKKQLRNPVSKAASRRCSDRRRKSS